MASSPTSTLSYSANQFYNQQLRSASMPSTPLMPKLHFNKNSSPARRMYPQNFGSGTMSSEMTTGTTGSSNSFTTKALRDDLLVAADSITGAMQDLVKELNSGMPYFNLFPFVRFTTGLKIQNLIDFKKPIM
jgi:hypothetical protein